jgi:pilus assembly protein Flp/PilA
LARYFATRARETTLKGLLVMSQLLARFAADRSGATAIEYGLLAAGISIAIIAVVFTLGTDLNTTFASVSTAIQ